MTQNLIKTKDHIGMRVNRNLIIVCLIMFIFFGTALKAQKHEDLFERVPIELGLNSTPIICITQDTAGYLWFGTWMGLFRYDGEKTKPYVLKSPQLKSNKIASMMVSTKGEFFLGTLRGGLLQYNYATDQFNQLEEPGITNVLRTSIWGIYEDKLGRIWSATEKGIAIYDPKDGSNRNQDVFFRSTINSKRIQFISDCGTDFIWVGTDDGMYCYYLDANGDITELSDFGFSFPNFTQEQSNFIYYIYNNEKKTDHLLVLCKSGIIDLDFSKGPSNVQYELSEKSSETLQIPRFLYKTSQFENEYLIGTHNGIKKMSQNGIVDGDLYIPNKIVRCIFEDKFGSLWVGTESGLYKYNQIIRFMKNYSFPDIDFGIAEHIEKSPQTKDIWIAWQNGKISKIPFQNGDYRFEKAEHLSIVLENQQVLQERISQISIHDKGEVMVATQGAGLIFFNEEKEIQKARIYPSKILNHRDGLNDNYIMAMQQDEEGIWLGTWNHGLQYYDYSSQTIQMYQLDTDTSIKLQDVPIVKLSISQEHPGKLFIATRGAGIYITQINKTKHSLELLHHIHAESSLDNSLDNNFITDIFVRGNKLYISSENGATIFDMTREQLKNIELHEPLHKSNIQALAISSDSTIWLSTYNDGFVELNTQNSEAKAKYYKNTTLSNYASASVLELKKNQFLFGASQGLTILNTDQKIEVKEPPIPIITEFKINNKELKSIPIILDNSSKKKRQGIQLDYQENIISIGISAIQTNEFQDMTYAYRLDGFHEDWIYVNENEKNVHFTNLPYRSYQFELKASNSDDVWSDILRLPIVISPPWWKTTLAYAIYFLLLLLLIYGIVKIFLIKINYDHQIKLEKLERNKIEEMNKLKLNFYTSISHELRTPLTMIISPLQQLIDAPETTNVAKTHQFILSNANKLLSMVNQLLDFRKHDSGGLDLILSESDFISFTNEIVLNFNSIKKGVDIQFESNVDHYNMVFDEDQMEKLYNNLIDNAIKYTEQGDKISINLEEQASENTILIQVKDTGEGMEKEVVSNIFKRFYQGKSDSSKGFGIGMSIVKSIVDVHEGNIVIDSKKGVGTTIHVTLPTNLEPNVVIPVKSNFKLEEEEHIHTEEFDEPIQEESAPTDRKKLLLVEDNEEIIDYLIENFHDEYEITEARNGEDGLAFAIQEIPDLIISDIAMPKMDGLEMSKQLKANVATSHIPIMLLTARTSLDYKIEGFDYGVNAFVTKPFNMSLLKKRVKSTMEYQDILKSKYRNIIEKDESSFTISLPKKDKTEEVFIQNLIEIIEKNLDNSDLTIDDLAKKLLMSRIQIYRKVKALTGQTPNAFIRDIRLKRAAQLLTHSGYSISEITYNVGFNDLKYFREKFKEAYKLNPSKYRQINKIPTDQSNAE